MSDLKRKGKAFYKGYSKKRRWKEELRPGLAGVLITCDGRERNAVAEAYRLLNEYADAKYGPEKHAEEDSDDSNELDIEEALKKEVADIKESNKMGTERRFQTVENKAKNVIFIRTASTINPFELVHNIFNDILCSEVRKSKFCLRFLPVLKTCYAKVDEIVKASKPIIEEYFHSISDPFTYCIMWKTRCNNQIKRDDVILRLVDVICEKECGHETEYKHPDVILNIDIIGNICCLGILRNYQKFRKYNLDMLLKETVVADESVKTENKDDVKKEIQDDGEKEVKIDAKTGADIKIKSMCNVEKADQDKVKKEDEVKKMENDVKTQLLVESQAKNNSECTQQQDHIENKNTVDKAGIEEMKQE
ncbi:THUMP domain-containing protein 1-like [Hydractinia symbiolongicarpus]|uniref:THUMP domain-containing protein 1-like n=1 Tax=Hydractinia symbiolongicarpus TaxID=13093 RepID=UPI0025501CD0|nr:THUMP domain-containing protein 1-like [Hydractinia symbiolongicarpus]